VFDLDGLLGDLERVLVDITKLAAEGTGSLEGTREYGLGDAVRVTSSVRIGFLDEMLPSQTTPPSVEREPMIDVMQAKDGLKVFVLLPGIQKKDVKVFARERSLIFEVNTRGRAYRRELPCDLPPSDISIRSMVENNSVVEITFARKKREALD
jgi:HSP20 family molecular chaperone IbpA